MATKVETRGTKSIVETVKTVGLSLAVGVGIGYFMIGAKTVTLANAAAPQATQAGVPTPLPVTTPNPH